MALEKIGPYNFQGILGRGGMGTVYRGRHEETGEIDAVKVLAPLYANDSHFRGRFESEIKALLKLDHPNIVQILSYGQDDGMLFFSMELVEGNSLFQMQRIGHQFDWREVLSIARDVANGLRHAHDRGVIHRDLKPGNLLMANAEEGKQGIVKITDFGIAKRFGNSQNTGTNVLGTMDFMSPEQAKGERVTIRSDIYSLGTVLYTLLSGKPPFSSNSIEESFRNLTVVPAPGVCSIVPNVPHEMESLIQSMMAKRPEDRIQTTQSLLFQIESVESDLREGSEAKTAHLPLPNELKNDTFMAVSAHTEVNTADPQSIANPTSDATPTVEMTDHTTKQKPMLSDEIDYFETVTDRTRKAQDSFLPDPPPRSKGIVPLALALLIVVALGGYGVYRTYLPPSAEAIYANIERSYERPQDVLEEMDLFLELYPDDPRSSNVAELQATGKAIQFYSGLCNQLSVRENINGDDRLTEIEKQFLQIVELDNDDPILANAKMAAFVTMFTNTDESDARTQACVNAAEGYQIKLQHDSRSLLNFRLQQIQAAMKSAAEASDPAKAISIYQSIIELYGDVEWGDTDEAEMGREQVRSAQEALDAIGDAQ